jgi:hypothetical protein
LVDSKSSFFFTYMAPGYDMRTFGLMGAFIFLART